MVNKALDRVRQYLAKDLGLVESGRHALLWVTDFPMYEWNEEQQRLEVSLHASLTLLKLPGAGIGYACMITATLMPFPH